MSKNSYFHRVSAQTPTRFWINNVTRQEADLALEAGAVGCTQNPAYVYKMLSHPGEKEHAFKALEPILAQAGDNDTAQEHLQRELVAEIAGKFLPLWQASGGRHGYVSIQGNPFKEDTENILASARFNREAGPNIMAKVPATKEGLAAIEILIAEGVPINATEVMGVGQALDLCEVYKKAAGGQKNPPAVYYSHITGIYDEYLRKYVKDKNITVNADSLWQAGTIIAHKTLRLTRQICPEIGFIGGGARGLHHFTEMVGADCCVTINWKGAAEDLIRLDNPVIDRFHRQTDDAVLDELLEKVDDFARGWRAKGLKADEYEEFGPVVLFRESFEEAWGEAAKLIGAKRA